MDISSYLAKAISTHKVTEHRWDETELQEQYETWAKRKGVLFSALTLIHNGHLT